MASPGKLLQAQRAENIASRENRWLKRFRVALRQGPSPAEATIGMEGARLVEEALRSPLAVEAVLVSASGERYYERLAPLLEPNVRLLRTSDRLFAGVADTQTPQGVAALVHPRVYAFDDLLRGGSAAAPLVVVLVGVQDPGNVGTIVRAAEAFGATGLAACAHGATGSAHPLSPKALRASAGSALCLPVVHGVGVSILLAQLRVAGVKLFAACPETAAAAVRTAAHGHPTASVISGTRPAASGPAILTPWQADLRGACALLIGNEGAGLPPDVEHSADARVRIPLAPGVESLNAAVAASVLLYEAARQRARDVEGL